MASAFPRHVSTQLNRMIISAERFRAGIGFPHSCVIGSSETKLAAVIRHWPPFPLAGQRYYSVMRPKGKDGSETEIPRHARNDGVKPPTTRHKEGSTDWLVCLLWLLCAPTVDRSADTATTRSAWRLALQTARHDTAADVRRRAGWPAGFGVHRLVGALPFA